MSNIKINIVENKNIVQFKNYINTDNTNNNAKIIVLKKTDYTKRDISYYIFNNCYLTGRNYFYPNVLINSNDIIINPYDEKVMSLNKSSFYNNNLFDVQTDINFYNHKKNIISIPVFFFIYNFDNYYHFLYDTLPYLYIYIQVKKQNKNIKLLINYPNKNMSSFYKFNVEFLEKLVDIKNDIIIHEPNNYYKEIYIGTSLTHSDYSNNPPRNEIYEIYDKIKKNINISNISSKYLNLDKIYISRRTWINNDNSNIGTNYTTRRKMMNEDELVNELTKIDFVEIFAENLNVDEKVYLFSNAKEICGAIGGGMSNLLFSNNNTKSFIIVTPYFLNINNRFKFSMENTNFKYLCEVNTYTNINKIPLYCRIEILENNKYGEIIDYNNDDDTYLINISNNDVAGFNNNTKFNQTYLKSTEFKLLDKGLNSPYIVNIKYIIDNL